MSRRRKPAPGADTSAQAGAEGPGKGIGAVRMLKFAGLTLGVVMAVFGLGWILWSADKFLNDDRRFMIGIEDEPGAPPAIEVSGDRNASRKAILEIFEQDRGRSLFKLDPSERKRQIDDLPWVKTSTVRRIWPNQVAVEIIERTPIAFIQAPSAVTGSMENPVAYKPMLIDGDGMILGFKPQNASSLPLLKGVGPRDPIEKRRARVRLLLLVLEELAPYRQRIPEVDLTAAPRVTIAYETMGATIELILGEDKWRKRLDYLNRNSDRIRGILRDRMVLDLTMEERVILKSSPGPPGREGSGQ
jgi:cell division protein FtsQ